MSKIHLMVNLTVKKLIICYTFLFIKKLRSVLIIIKNNIINIEFFNDIQKFSTLYLGTNNKCCMTFIASKLRIYNL